MEDKLPFNEWIFFEYVNEFQKFSDQLGEYFRNDGELYEVNIALHRLLDPKISLEGSSQNEEHLGLYEEHGREEIEAILEDSSPEMYKAKMHADEAIPLIRENLEELCDHYDKLEPEYVVLAETFDTWMPAQD